MSQRLHVGATNEQFYDCVLTSPDGARDRLLNEWMKYTGGMFVGPWKIRIGDIALFEQVEPVIAELLTDVGKVYPDDICCFYLSVFTIEHPTADELRAWLERK